MRACFLGQNVCALGYGVAMVQTPPLVPDVKLETIDPAYPEPVRKDVAPPNRMFADLLRHAPHQS
jgi:hypothetical protein